MEWKPNEKQVAFLGVLKGAEKPLTLREVSKVLGYEVKSGSVSVLKTKGLVDTEDRQLHYNKVEVETGEVLGHGTVTVKAYFLVKQD